MKHVLRILIPFILFLPFAMADDLPELGDSSALALSPLDEKRIADQIMRDVMSSDEVVSDPEINDYIQNLGVKLAGNSPDKLQHFDFFVVKDNTINAFAMPGGVVGVHTGLILAASNEAELASVLGHEIGHVVQHHMARMLAQQKNDSIISLASMALSILAARANTQLATAAMTTSTASSIQKQLDYSRENEREADRVGIQILENSGYDTNAMASFFETLQKGTRFSEGAAPSFLRTHPLTSERIADVKDRISKSANFHMVVYAPDFDYVRAKLISGMGTPRQAIDVFQNSLQEKKYYNEAAQHYGLALALMRNREWEGVNKQLAWLRSNANWHPMFATLAANLEVAKDNPQQAAKQYLAGLATFPDYRALIYGYAEHLINVRQPTLMINFVKEKQTVYQDDPYLYELLSKAYALLGKNLLSHQALAESYQRSYNLEKALEQMDIAVRSGDGDFYQQSIVEARWKQLSQQVEDIKKNKLK